MLPGPNMLVLGRIGCAKSSFVKTYLFRQALFGRQAWVLDPKGEYAPLARALGVAPIALEPGGEVRLNPITRRGGRSAPARPAALGRPAALRRELDPEEDAGLRVALDLVNEECGAGEPTPAEVVEVLLCPRRGDGAGRLAASARGLRRGQPAARLALQRLCEGDLRGMFDGPTTPASTSTRRWSSST